MIKSWSQKPLDVCRAYGLIAGKECGYSHIAPRRIQGVPPGLIMRYVIEQYIKFHGQDPDQIEWTYVVSYDVYLTADLGGPERACLTDWNYTSNCAPMWRLAGADLAEFHDRPASECLHILTEAITRMTFSPDEYRAMNPGNGWGSYDSVLAALRQLADQFAAYPNATVRVSR